MKRLFLIFLFALILFSSCPEVQSKPRSRASKRKSRGARTTNLKQGAKYFLTTLALQPGNRDKDVFEVLPPMMKYSFRGTADRKLSDHRSQLLGLPSTITVNVTLVGFEKGHHSSHGVIMSIDTLKAHLDALDTNVAAAVLEPGPPLELSSIQPTIDFKVSHSSKEFSDRIDKELLTAISIERMRPGRYDQELYQLSYQSIDRVIAEDHVANQRKSAAHHMAQQGLTIYIINPNRNHSMDSNQPQLDYLYSYEELGDEKPQLHSSCPGLHYASPNEHYLWVDISAGPTAYGPSSGRGSVLPHTFPHPQFYKEQEVSTAIIPDFAAMIWSAAQHYVWPPLLHLEGIKRADKVTVQIIHMHESLGPPPDNLDQKIIESILSKALSDIQEVEVAESWLPFANCDVCVAAYYSAKKVRMGHQEGDSAFTPVSSLTVLDSQSLYQSLSRHKDAIMGYAGVEYVSDDKHHHHLPVFVFDVSIEAATDDLGLLIDGKSKAKAFPDLVMAVSSKARTTHSSISCRWFKCEPDGANVTREVLAAVMSAGWGVSDDSVYYSRGSGPGMDYRWSLGATPFGPLSHRLALSHASSQILRRNLALSGLEATSIHAVRIVDAISSFSPSDRIDGRTIPIYEVQVSLMTRLNLCQLKLSEAAQYIGLGQYGHALSMVRSAEIDLRELEAAARKVALHFKHAVLECEGGLKGTGWQWGVVWSYAWAPIGAASLIPIAFFVRRRLPWNSIQLQKQDKIF